jgi:23S rRNA (cytidine1920-2'-O)/16S rRNA (cytidine1409-2'-O)-methyltransferase
MLEEKMTAIGKTRIDLLLVERGLFPSRERARAMILAGRVLVNEQKIDKPGASVPESAAIRILGDDLPFVSRGGLKLDRALDHWKIDVTARACLDVGASTGGFTDCLLQRGAAHVTAVDTGFGQIAMKLRIDPRVRLLERTNARFLAPGALAEEAGIPHPTLLVMDVSFISATILIGPVLAAAPSLTEAVILVKPQFEVAIDKVAANVLSLGWIVVETIESPITGAEGNHEFLLFAQSPAAS